MPAPALPSHHGQSPARAGASPPREPQGRSGRQGQTRPHQVEQVLDNLAHALTAEQRQRPRSGGQTQRVPRASDDAVPTVEAAWPRALHGQDQARRVLRYRHDEPSGRPGQHGRGGRLHPEDRGRQGARQASVAHRQGGARRRRSARRPRCLRVQGRHGAAPPWPRPTRKTLASLHDLALLDLDETHVVQVRILVHPMTKLDEVRNEITAFFGKESIRRSSSSSGRSQAPSRSN